MADELFWGGVLRALRIKNNLTQKEVASILHISRQAYSSYETGRTHPTPETITVLSNIYNVNLYDFINASFSSEYVKEQDLFMSRLALAKRSKKLKSSAQKENKKRNAKGQVPKNVKKDMKIDVKKNMKKNTPDESGDEN